MEIEFNAKEAANINRPRRQWNIWDVYLATFSRRDCDVGGKKNNDILKLRSRIVSIGKVIGTKQLESDPIKTVRNNDSENSTVLDLVLPVLYARN